MNLDPDLQVIVERAPGPGGQLAGGAGPGNGGASCWSARRASSAPLQAGGAVSGPVSAPHSCLKVRMTETS